MRAGIMLTSALAAVMLSSCASLGESGASRDPVRLTTPAQEIPITDQQVLFWDRDTRLGRFGHMEDYFAGYEVAPSRAPREFPAGDPLPIELQGDIADYMAASGTVGVMVVQNGQMRHIAFGAGFSGEDRWTSFSVAKSFTSTLLGAAVADGLVESLDDPVTRYIPGLAGSAYDAVTVRQLATMTSGVRWNEDYTDPQSDVARMLATPPAEGQDQSVIYMRTLDREAPPGERWVYKTGETNLLGILVENATGMTLAEYAKDNLVDPAGFADPMFWMVDLSGRNIGGCCLSLTLADYTRFGQWVLDRSGEGDVVPAGWFGEAGAPSVSIDGDRFGYGYQWWTYGDENFGAQGIFGQSITILPQANMVVAMVGNWDTATSGALSRQRLALVSAIAAEGPRN